MRIAEAYPKRPPFQQDLIPLFPPPNHLERASVRYKRQIDKRYIFDQLGKKYSRIERLLWTACRLYVIIEATSEFCPPHQDWKKIDVKRFSRILNPKLIRYDFSLDAVLKQLKAE